MMGAGPGAPADELSDRLQLSLAADSSLLATVRLFVASLAQQSGMSEERAADLRLAVSEVAAALIETGADRIEVDAQLGRDMVSIRVQSPVPGFEAVAADGSIRHRLLEALFRDARFGEDGSWSVMLDARADAVPGPGNGAPV